MTSDDTNSTPEQRGHIIREKLGALDEVSRNNVIVRQMIEDGLSFNRVTYIDLFYAGKTPKPWTDLHESRLPPIFQDTNTDLIREAIQNLGDAIGVTYTGEIPK
jgi:hypothetical protein